MKYRDIKFDAKKASIEVIFDNSTLKINPQTVEVSYFSGRKGGQNVNRNLNGVRLSYLIPEEFRYDHKKTRVISVKCVKQRRREQNINLAFAELAHKLECYFYVPKNRKATRVPKFSREKRLQNKRINKQKKLNRQSPDF